MSSAAIVLVFGADLDHKGTKVVLGPETLSALHRGREVATRHHCPILASAGYTLRYGVVMGEVMLAWMREHALTQTEHPAVFADTFNSLGEARAFWTHIEATRNPEHLKTVYVVARGVHSWRTAFLVWKLRPPQFRSTKVVRVQAPSEDKRLLRHELKSWAKITLLVLQGKL